MIDIKGKDKASILAVLYNNSQVQGMGIFQQKPGLMSKSEAQELLDKSHDKYFDYLYGKIMKIDLSGDELNPRLYDRDNGDGACLRALTEAKIVT